MLILTRKIDEAIVIHGDTTVKVLGIERDRVKLGTKAPEKTKILREELVGGEAAGPREHNGKGMLILTRKIDEAIVLTDPDATVRVLGIERDRVKLGIAAAEDIIILREELTEGSPQPEGRESRSQRPPREGQPRGRHL